jgi:hypothetical protein
LYYTTSQCWSESLECNDHWNWPTPVVPGEVDAIARDACKKIVKDGGQLVTNKKDFQKWREPKASRVAYRWNATWWRNTFEGDNGWCPFEPRGAHHVQGVDDCVDQLTAPFHRCEFAVFLLFPHMLTIIQVTMEELAANIGTAAL